MHISLMVREKGINYHCVLVLQYCIALSTMKFFTLFALLLSPAVVTAKSAFAHFMVLSYSVTRIVNH